MMIRHLDMADCTPQKFLQVINIGLVGFVTLLSIHEYEHDATKVGRGLIDQTSNINYTKHDSES